ncbi:MAG: hypothetical protein WCR47_03740, partial [Desulfoplanes sp.]
MPATGNGHVVKSDRNMPSIPVGGKRQRYFSAIIGEAIREKMICRGQILTHSKIPGPWGKDADMAILPGKSPGTRAR